MNIHNMLFTKKRARWINLLSIPTVTLMLPIAALSQPLTPVNLRSTANFAILAGSTVSDIPASAITGDIGLSPAAGSMITGFGASEVTGSIFTVDATGPAGSIASATQLTTAKSDLTLAYNDAAGRVPIPTGTFLNPGSGNIGGLTLIPGLYKFTSTLAITGSDVTLQGNANDVWIFQVASDLVVGNGIHVILAGGAQAANIFWQIGTSAVLGTTSVFKGTIMADQSITLNTGATLNGRALASIAAVTLASSTVTKPSLATFISNGRAEQKFSIFQKYSDPQNPTMSVEFMVPTNGRTTLRLLDTRGQEVATLFNGQTEAGEHYRIPFNTRVLAKGRYFSKLEFNGKPQLTKMLLIN